MHMHTLSPLQRKLLIACFDEGLRDSLQRISSLAGSEVEVRIPESNFVPISAIMQQLCEKSSQWMACAVQKVRGGFNGEALLVYTGHFARIWSDHLHSSQLGGEGPAPDELVNDILTETSNMIITNCLSQMANLLQVDVEVDIPVLHRENAREMMQHIVDDTGQDRAGMVIISRIKMRTPEEIETEMVILMTREEIGAFMELLKKRINGE